MNEITERRRSVADEQTKHGHNEIQMVWNTSTFLEDHKNMNKVYILVITGYKRKGR